MERGTGEQLCCLQGRDREGGLEIRRGEDLSEIFRVFCLLAGASCSQAQCSQHPRGAGGPSATPCDCPCTGSCWHHLSSRLFLLPESGDTLPARKLQRAKRLGARIGAGRKMCSHPTCPGTWGPTAWSPCPQDHPAHGVLPAYRAAPAASRIPFCPINP